MENEIVIEGIVDKVESMNLLPPDDDLLEVALAITVGPEMVIRLPFTISADKAHQYYIGRRVRLNPKPLPRSAS